MPAAPADTAALLAELDRLRADNRHHLAANAHLAEEVARLRGAKPDLPPAPAGPPPGSVWVHRKHDTPYRVYKCGRIEKDLTPCVVYEPVSGGDVWVRPVSEFMDGRFTPTPEVSGAR